MILCFSGTGNTLYVARRAREAFGDNIVRVGFDELPSTVAEPLGIMFPVYFYGVPRLMREALESIDASASPYVYAVTTCGGDAGIAARVAEKALGRHIDAAFSIVMPDNYILLYDPPEDADGILRKAETEIQRMLSDVSERKSEPPCASSWYSLLETALRPAYGYFACRTKPFYVKGECTSCGRCAAVCPSHAIIMRGGKPAWVKPHCTGCLACINLCPNAVIQHGRATELRKRYYHPEIFKII